jgi:hypothetical protein
MSQHGNPEEVTEEVSEESLLQLIEAKQKLNELDWSDRARLLAQGFAMGWSDEFIAGVKSLSPNIEYEDAIKEERKELKDAQSKEGSLKYEIGGAVIPALIAAPFTGGTSIPATAARYALGTGTKLLTQGAIQGATTTIGQKEGSLGERVGDNAIEIGLNTVGGAILNPLVQKVGGKVVNVVKGAADPIIRKLKGQLGKKVEDELTRIAKKSGLEIDEIIEQIRLGKTIPELNETVAAEVRSFYSKASDSKSIISEGLRTRADTNLEAVTKGFQEDLAPDAKVGNILQFVQQSQAGVKKAASDNYNKIYEQFSDFKSNNLNLAIEEILQKQPKLRGKLRSLMTGLGKDTPFDVKDGVLTITQDIDLKTAEKIRGILAERANKLYKGGYGTLGEVASNLEKNLRGIIDKTSPDLAQARAKWSSIMDSRDSFEEGSKVFAKSADEIDIIFENLISKGNKEAIASFRAGVANSIRGKSQSANMTTFINNVDNLTKKERLILTKIYPDEALDSILNKINLAKDSLMARNKVLAGSQTAETLEGSKAVGTVDDAYILGRVVASSGSDIGAVVQLIKKFIPSKKIEGLNEDQLKQVSKLLVSEDKELIEKALTDKTSREQLFKNTQALIDRFVAGLAQSSVVTDKTELLNQLNPISTGRANEINTGDYKVITDLTKTISPKTREKLMKIYADGTYGEVYDDTGEAVVGSRRKPTQN